MAISKRVDSNFVFQASLLMDRQFFQPFFPLSFTGLHDYFLSNPFGRKTRETLKNGVYAFEKKLYILVYTENFSNSACTEYLKM